MEKPCFPSSFVLPFSSGVPWAFLHPANTKGRPAIYQQSLWYANIQLAHVLHPDVKRPVHLGNLIVIPYAWLASGRVSLDPESSPGVAVAHENTGLLGCRALCTNIPTLCRSSKEKRRSTSPSLGRLHLTEAKNGQHFPQRVDWWFFLGGSWAPEVVGGSGCGSSHRRPGQRMRAGMTEPWAPGRAGG